MTDREMLENAAKAAGRGKIRTGSWIYVNCEEHLRAY